MTNPYNIGNSIFTGFNDKGGIFICGYEWGWSKEDQEEEQNNPQHEDALTKDAQTIFSNKSPVHGEKAFKWKYDNKIIRWFDIWGHPLRRDGLGGEFEKCLLQTNWCDTQNHHIDENYYDKLIDEVQVENFIAHVSHFEPNLIMFCGSTIIDVLQNSKVLQKFKGIMGEIKKPLYKCQKPFNGRRFKVGFQEFERCKIVSLPHPSSSRGLRDEYIELFRPEISALIQEVKISKNIS